ncbi:MAG: M14 family metallopeptidase [Candidatus Aminicenantes bacterium]|nr:M14 family metallopeptidase [Candidatus Aminicenantes bacterium]
MKHATRALGAVGLALMLAAAGAQDFGKYHNYAEMTALAQGLGKAYPEMVKIESIGKTRDKRDLWAIQIAAPAGVPPAERPGLLIAAGFEADHVYGSELALFTADYLLRGYPGNPAVKKALDENVVYILPRVNPDGAEFMWAPIQWARRTNTTPFDDDNDGRIDEDGPDDLNKDGFITVMRVKDPNGAYMIDPDDKRAMKKADPKKGERGEYSLFWEGIDNDGDGFINEDGPGGVNLNRNFMHEYPGYKAEAGRYMVSESETKAVLAWTVAHRNIAAILTFGESDNLIAAVNAQGRYGSARPLDLVAFAEASIAGAGKTGIFPAGGLAGLFGRGGRGGGGGGEMMISEDMLQALMASGGAQFTAGGAGGQRGGQPAAAAASQAGGRAAQPSRQAVVVFNAADVDYFRTISAKYAELTGIRTAPVLAKPEGAFFQVGYFQFGVPSFSTPGWGLPEAARGQGVPGPGGAGAPGAGGQANAPQMMAQRGGMNRAGGVAGAPGAEAGEAAAIDKAVLQWMDKEKIDGFAAWTAFKHPDLGDIEIGGFKPYATVNPPAAKIAEMGKPHAEFALYLTTLFSKVKIAKLEATAQGGGLYRVKAEVANEGVWPTAMAHAVTARAVKPTMVQLQVDPAAILSGNQKTSFVQSITGAGERVKFDWLIKAKAGVPLVLKVVSAKGGADSRSVTLQ